MDLPISIMLIVSGADAPLAGESGTAVSLFFLFSINVFQV